jgi:hypothetical protein
MAMVTANQSRSARVRPYTITGGRTRTRRPLLLETLISVPRYDQDVRDRLIPESRDIYVLCQVKQSIAEISTRLGMPLGVVRVLVSDLADQGEVQVHPTGSVGGQPDRGLLERVLRGLQTIS